MKQSAKFVILVLSSVNFLFALDVQLLNKTPRTADIAIITKAIRPQDLFTEKKDYIEGIPSTIHFDDFPVWRGFTNRTLQPNQAILIASFHPRTESIRVNNQELSFNDLPNIKETQTAVIPIAINQGKIWGVTFELMGFSKKQSAQKVPIIPPRTNEYLTS